MWLPVFLLSVAFTGVFADISDDIEECTKIVDVGDLQDIEKLPDADELKAACPAIIHFMRCFEDVVKEHTGFTLEELAEFMEMTGNEKARFVTVFTNFLSLAEELCDENSQLNNDYLTHSECFRSVDDSDDTGLCYKVAKAAYEAHRGIENEIDDDGDDNDNAITNDDDDDDDDDDDSMPNECIIPSYEAACLGVEIHDECGPHAFETYMDIMRRTTIFKHGLCTEGQLEDAKNKFFEHLEEDSPHRDLFHLAFDLKRRRK